MAQAANPLTTYMPRHLRRSPPPHSPSPLPLAEISPVLENHLAGVPSFSILGEQRRPSRKQPRCSVNCSARSNAREVRTRRLDGRPRARQRKAQGSPRRGDQRVAGWLCAEDEGEDDGGPWWPEQRRRQPPSAPARSTRCVPPRNSSAASFLPFPPLLASCEFLVPSSCAADDPRHNLPGPQQLPPVAQGGGGGEGVRGGVQRKNAISQADRRGSVELRMQDPDVHGYLTAARNAAQHRESGGVGNPGRCCFDSFGSICC